jgi:hypothetical protein
VWPARESGQSRPLEGGVSSSARPADHGGPAVLARQAARSPAKGTTRTRGRWRLHFAEKGGRGAHWAALATEAHRATAAEAAAAAVRRRSERRGCIHLHERFGEKVSDGGGQNSGRKRGWRGSSLVLPRREEK